MRDRGHAGSQEQAEVPGATTLRGALIGCGRIAIRHVQAWDAIDGAGLVAVCDTDPYRAQSVAASAGVTAWYSSAAQMLEELGPDLDFLDIATPAPAHRGLTQAGFGRGLHVLCQKPMADSGRDTLALVELAGRTELVFAVNEIWKWIPAYQRVAEILRSGALGQVHAARFSCTANLLLPIAEDLAVASQDSVSAESAAVLRARLATFGLLDHLVVMEQGVHVLDIMRSWFGEPSALRCFASRLSPALRGPDDAAFIRLRYETFFADIVLDWARPGSPAGDLTAGESFAVRGDAGVLSVSAARRVEWHRSGRPPERETYDGDIRARAFAGSHGDFIRAITRRRLPASSAEDNARTQSMAFACYASAASDGQWIENPTEWLQSTAGTAGG